MKTEPQAGLSLALHFTVSGVLFLSLLLSPLSAAELTPEQLAFFENEIRPLLVKHCYECHSDKDHLEGELSLASAAGLTHGGASGPAVIAGNPKESLLIKAVEYRGIEMPPNGKLPKTDIDKLVRWVEMGAPWPSAETPDEMSGRRTKNFEFTEEHLNHWAFQPVQSPLPPEVDHPAWNQHPIDRFLYAEMVRRGIEPAGVAEKSVLLRRVTYDLTGLPPTPEELHQFLADESPDAWEKVIDRLLASPRYGERWGRHWLDVVRYADTAGDASDYPLPDAYKYRNYVISSMNSDKPYDQFLREQYAGDLYAKDAPPEQFEELTTATTYLAIARRFGYNDTNFHYFHLTIHDLLDNMGQSVLGLSIGCARCHDHKFEPISAKDYYALYGIFESSKFTFPGGEEVRFPKDLIPAVPSSEATRRQQERDVRIAEFDQKIQALTFQTANLSGGFEAENQFPPTWSRNQEAVLVQGTPSPFSNVFPPGKQAIQLPNDARKLGFRRPLATRTAATAEPLYLNFDFRNVGVDAGGDGHYRVALDHPENGYSAAVELFINGSRLAVRDGEALKEIAPLELTKWYNLQVKVDWVEKTFSGVLTDGSNNWTFEKVPFNPSWDGVVKSWVVDTHGTEAENARPLRELDNFCEQNEPFHAASYTVPSSGNEKSATLGLLQEALKKVQAEKSEFSQQPAYPTIYGVREGKPANARLQYRGEPDRLGDEVPRGFLSILGGQRLADDCQESGRRQLADWLTSPTNPLTARVIVNRIWYYHFGRGIVATPNDFGVRGEPPTHPQLLDYLATRFREEGYSFKAMHRLLLTSRAYQLSSDGNERSMEVDPANAAFSRHQRRRLDAESLRDTWLSLAGTLDLTVGEAHPFPPVSNWTFSQHVPFDAVYESNLRTVYLMTQRIKRHPFLALFDGPDPNASTGKREVTTTPAQALFMMNDPFMHECSTNVARKLREEVSTGADQIARLFELCYARQPTASEQAQAALFLEVYANKIPGDPERQLKSFAAFVRVVLSSNEFLYLN